MFSARVVAQLLHKRKENRERNILYIPATQEQVNKRLNQMKNEYLERVTNKRVDGVYQQYGYGF